MLFNKFFQKSKSLKFLFQEMLMIFQILQTLVLVQVAPFFNKILGIKNYSNLKKFLKISPFFLKLVKIYNILQKILL